MTYLQFLAIFLAVPLAVLLAVGRPRLPGLGWQLALIAAVAVVYTGPWDAALIGNGVWSYAPAQVGGGTVLGVPLEEFGFYVLQVVVVGLFTAVLWRRLQPRAR